MPAPSRRARLAAWSWLAAAAMALPAASQETAAAGIKERVELLRTMGSVQVGTETIRSIAILPRVYEAGGFEPLWSERALDSLTTALADLASDGLDPAAYHLTAIRALRASRPAPSGRADLDIVATDALATAVHDLRFGRVSIPARGGAEGGPPLDDPTVIRKAILSGRIAAALDEARPRHALYTGLVDALARLRTVAAGGGWGVVPPGPPLRIDSVDARVAALRRRLELEGDLPRGTSHAAGSFDATLEAAVRSFQHRHGLNEDGVVGAATLAALNVPVETRIDQVRVNLERARWVVHGLPGTLLAVNAAGARVYLMRDDRVVFESRAVVGSTSTATPVFRATLRYIDLNPTWTVPPGIVDEVLAAIRRDPRYLAREGMRVLDRGGRTVDASAIDFRRYSGRTFPYVFRQDPGPRNPLGRVKFVFPNRFNVYLHDTPARELFERERRLFSHGCVRVQDPLVLAERVLDDPAWSRRALEEAIARGTTRTLTLREPIPVLILYWTAAADLHGELHFYPDVYGRDGRVLEALDAR